MIRPDHSDKPEPWETREAPKGADIETMFLIGAINFCVGAIFGALCAVLGAM